MSEPPSSLTSTSTTEDELSSEAVTQIHIKTPAELTIIQTSVAKIDQTVAGPSSRKYEIDITPSEDDKVILGLEAAGRQSPREYDPDDDDDDTLSSEAVVDDIELILMPEETEELSQQSPKLVRVRELHMDDQGQEMLEDEDEDDDCRFRKMDLSERSQRSVDVGSEEEEEELEEEGAVGYTPIPITFQEFGGTEVEMDDDEPSFASSTTSGRLNFGKGRMKRIQSLGVQTDITALENNPTQPCIFDCRGGRRELGKAYSGKKLNWKSEMTLLPSKTKIGRSGGSGIGGAGGGFGYGDAGEDRDDYATPRGVTKFTSQDNVLNASSQFLKPSTLYRTRNLSRNLNQLGSSETILPVTETTSAQPSPRCFPPEWTHASTSKGLKASAFRRPLSGFSAPAKNFRSSLPDLNTMSIGGTGYYHDNTPQRRRQSCFHSATEYVRKSGQKVASGSGRAGPSTSGTRKFGRKKSSSDDETSSLIDESERCLRSSIDLLLTDDLPAPGFDYPYSGSKSSRRYCSQPILSDEAYFSREPRDKVLGSPFLPRRMADMRCSKWAKVILPNGQVSVVSVMEMDEIRDMLTVQTDTGCVANIPFRKVVFAWRSRR